MADLSKLILTDNTTVILKDNSQVNSDHRHYGKDMVPLVHKVYESTSYYATSAGDWNTSSWYFMSVKPDSWYKPWRVKFKVHSYCPAYETIESLTYTTITGRADSMAYANWNELHTTAHYYTVWYPLKKAGFDAGYGHAIGISILYASNYTSSAYYRTFEIDYYECENCTVTILDTPVKWSSWTGTGTTNYGGIVSGNASSRGLQETGDADSNNALYVRNYYSRPVAGTNGFKQYCLFARQADGRYTSFTTDSGTGTKTFDTTTVFDFSMIYWFSSGSNFNPDTMITSNSIMYTQYPGVDMRYSFNGVTTSDSTSSLVKNKPLYLVVSHDWKLTSPYYTQTPTASDTVYYVRLGDMFSAYQLDLWQYNPIYEYDGTIFTRITNANADTVDYQHIGVTDDVTIYKSHMEYTTETPPTDYWYVKIKLDRMWSSSLVPILINASYSNILGKIYFELDGYNSLFKAYRTTYNGCNVVGIKRENIDGKNHIWLKLAKPVTYAGSIPNGKVSVYSPVKILSIEQVDTDPEGWYTLRDGYNSNTNFTASQFYGNLSGTASYATNDASGNNIKATYASSFSISDRTITLKNKNGGSLGTVTVPASPTSATSSTTGISIADHGTTDIIGVQSSTTTASKVTLGTAFTVPNVTSAGSASNWVFEDITVPKAASSATSIPNVTAVGSGSFTSGSFSGGSGSFTATVTKGVLSFSHTHTAATHGADSHTHTAPTLGTAISITGVSGSTTASHVKSGGNGSAPTLGTAFTIPNVTGASEVTVPKKNTSATAVVTGKTHTVTDNGHTHTLS